MLGRRAKAGVLVAAFLVWRSRGMKLISYYGRYYGSEAAPGTASGAPPSSASAFEVTMPEGAMPEGTASEQTTATGEAVAGFLAGRISVGPGIPTRGTPGSRSDGAPLPRRPRRWASPRRNRGPLRTQESGHCGGAAPDSRTGCGPAWRGARPRSDATGAVRPDGRPPCGPTRPLRPSARVLARGWEPTRKVVSCHRGSGLRPRCGSLPRAPCRRRAGAA